MTKICQIMHKIDISLFYSLLPARLWYKYHIPFLHMEGNSMDTRIILTPADDLQHAFDKAPPGSRIFLSPGEYRQKVVIRTPRLHIDGESGIAASDACILSCTAKNSCCGVVMLPEA